VKFVAATTPNDTLVAPVKFVPVTVMTVPPAVLPEVYDRLVTVGADAAEKVNRSALDVAEFPLGVSIVISYVPAASGGDIAVIDVSEFTAKLLAAILPKKTDRVPINPPPVMVTEVPPAVVPVEVLRLDTLGVPAELGRNRPPALSQVMVS
jgi:hypothetical protein